MLYNYTMILIDAPDVEKEVVDEIEKNRYATIPLAMITARHYIITICLKDSPVLQYFKDNGIRLKVLDLPTTLMECPEGQEWVWDMVNNILIEVIGTIAQQERETTKARQSEGIAVAKSKGISFGRPKAQQPDNWDSVICEWKNGNITAKRAMELTQTKRTTFYKLAKSDII